MSADDATSNDDATAGQPDPGPTPTGVGDKNGNASPACRHCGIRKGRVGRNASRGLCNVCYADKAIRELHPKARRRRRERVGPRRHCGREGKLRPRRLCTPCYEDKAVREKHAGGFAPGYEGTRQRPGRRLPAEPTTALPGTPEKVEVLRQRAARGEILHHPDDARLDAVDAAVLLELFGGIEAYQLRPREPRFKAARLTRDDD